MAEPLPLCYLNGAYLPLTEARISPLDRGFLYADAVYELMPVYGGRPFRFAAHGERLTRSLAGISMADPHTREEWRAILGALIERNGGGDCYVYWQVTRGAQSGRTHAPLPHIPRTLFAVCAPLPGRRCRDPPRQPLGALRHQVHRAAGERAAAPIVRGRGSRGDHPAARWRADGSLRFRGARSARRGAAHAATLAPDPAGHHARRSGRAGGPQRHTLPGGADQRGAAARRGRSVDLGGHPRGAAGDLPRRPPRRHG